MLYATLVVTFGFSPYYRDVGHQPVQPVPFSHKLHAGDLGMDCRYCHQSVERQPFAAVPATETCMACHSTIRTTSDKLEVVRDSWENNKPIAWMKVHDIADYAYFNHNAHVSKGVGCVSCHGRVDQMEVVHQVKPLSMGWCLECHRAPEANLRPLDKITQMDWTQKSPAEGEALRKLHNVNPQQACSTCHR